MIYKEKHLDYHPTFSSNCLCQRKKMAHPENTPEIKCEARILYPVNGTVIYKGYTQTVTNMQGPKEILFLWALLEESIRERDLKNHIASEASA